MILVDSSAWIEYFAHGSLWKVIHQHIKEAKSVIVPTVVLFEVYRKIAKTISSEEGLSVVAFMSTHQIVDISKEVALTAADLSLEYELGMADSLVLATAQEYNALLLTFDYDFNKIPDVKILKRS